MYSAIDTLQEINEEDGDDQAHQVDDAGSSQPDWDEDGDELGKPESVKEIKKIKWKSESELYSESKLETESKKQIISSADEMKMDTGGSACEWIKMEYNSTIDIIHKHWSARQRWCITWAYQTWKWHWDIWYRCCDCSEYKFLEGIV